MYTNVHVYTYAYVYRRRNQFGRCVKYSLIKYNIVSCSFGSVYIRRIIIIIAVHNIIYRIVSLNAAVDGYYFCNRIINNYARTLCIRK